MNWIASKLVLWAIVFVVSILAAIVSRRTVLRKFFGVSCVVSLLLVLMGGCHLLVSSPGFEDTEKENAKVKDKDKDRTPPQGHANWLKAPWNSEDESDWPAAESLALLCQISYQPPVDAKASFRNLGVDDLETIAINSMLGYVVYFGDVAVVVFRGTDDDFDWFCNLNSVTLPTLHGPIHKGFQSSYMALKPQIKKILDDRRPKFLWVTGHSLGGALAVVCAYDLAENDRRSIYGVVTFGQPMVAGQQLASHLDKALEAKYAHFVNGADFVPRVPPHLKHCGSLVWYKDDEVLRSKPKRMVFGGTKDVVVRGEVLPRMSDQEFEKLKATVRAQRGKTIIGPDGRPIYQASLPFVTDHSIDLYLDKIRKHRAGRGD